MTRIAAPDAKRRLDELLEAADRGEEVVITTERGGEYKVVPVRAGRSRGGFGALRGQIRMAEDFDAPLEEFEDYM